MTPYELFDIALSVGNRIDVQWGLFITAHLGLFGGIIYVDRPLRRYEKVGALAIYACFIVLNYRMMRLQMNVLQNAWRQIADLAAQGCCAGNQLIDYVVVDVASGRFFVSDVVLLGGHGLMAALVIASIVFDRAVGGKDQRREG